MKPDPVLIDLLKDEIQNKLGGKILYAADCHALSVQIQNSTARLVSVSTLKRFFGIINSTFAPSKYTLDTLAIYLQFNNWQEFVSNFAKETGPASQQETWDSLRTRSGLITNTSLRSLKNRIGTRFENFPLRSFAEKKFDEFLNSPKIATAFIAPDGFGKSTIVAQLTEKFFTGVDAKYPNDIICLVDGGILYNLLNYNFNTNQLYNLIEYNPAKSFSATFRGQPERIKGRIVVIIEGIDDIYSESEKTNRFVNNLLKIISVYENIEWYKVVITCRPNVWRMFMNQMRKNQILKSLWFNVAFQGSDVDIINIPLLKRKEIKAILERNHFPQTLDDLCFTHPDILDIISNAYMLHLFLSTYFNGDTIRDIDLLKQYVLKSVLSPPYVEEKYMIIQSFFTLCSYGKKGNEVKKCDLKLSSSLIIAYDELIRSGILYEYSLDDSYLSLVTFVKFTQNDLFAYYLANALIKVNVLNTDFLKSIIDGYKNTPHLGCDIIKYIVKILFKEEQVELLKNIFAVIGKESLPADVNTFNKPTCALTNVIGVELRKNQKLREQLIPCYAQTEAGRKLYFERFFDLDSLVLHSGNDLDCYLQYNQSKESQHYVCFMKFMQYFLSENKELCKAEYERSLNLVLPEASDSIITSFYFIPQIIYQSVFEKKVDSNIIEDVYNMSDRLIQNGTQNRTEFPVFETNIIFFLEYGRMNKEIIDLAHYIFDHYDLINYKSSCFYQLFLSAYARALLDTGETKKAIETYDQVELGTINIPEHMKYYFKIRLLFIKAEFLIYKRKFRKARLLLGKIKAISQMLKFSYFYDKASGMEKHILTIPDVVD